MTFDTPGYEIQGGSLYTATTGNLTVTTNVDATIDSFLSTPSGSGGKLTKNGSATLNFSGAGLLYGTVQVNQGELRMTNGSLSDFTLANAPGVALTLAPVGSTNSLLRSLAGGGSSGGVVHPDSLAGATTLQLYGSKTFGGRLEDNGANTLAVNVYDTPTWTNINSYSGPTSITGKLTLAGSGTTPNTPISIDQGTLLLNNSGTGMGDRISDSFPLTATAGAIQLMGNSATPVEEVAGQLVVNGAVNVTVTQPGSAATQLTFAGIQRNDHATLNVQGPGVGITGLSNGATRIVAPYFTSGNDWATIGGDGRITPLSSYTSDINAGSPSDHVKLNSGGTTTLASDTTRASLNLQNSNILNGAGHSLELTSGGILSSSTGSRVIQNGSVSTPAQEMVVTTNSDLTISSAIVESAGATALTKTGLGTLTLSGPNTYAGPTAITQGTLVVSSDANLGAGSTIEFDGGNLKAAGSFSSAKTLVASGRGATIDTAGFDLAFAGMQFGDIGKVGAGTLAFTSTPTGSIVVADGVLQLPQGIAGTVSLWGTVLQASGTVSQLTTSNLVSANSSILDIGGVAAATLTIESLALSPNFNPQSPSLLIDFGIGSVETDFLAITNPDAFADLNPGAFQFEFSDLGGVMPGVAYPLMSFSESSAPSPDLFAFAPDMAALGWSGSFAATTNSLSVTFSSVPVPEPGTTALLLLQGAALAFAARRITSRR